MRGVWLYFKKSLSCCNAQKSTVVVVVSDKNQTQKTNGSMLDLRNELVTNGPERAIMQNPNCFSSRSMESSNFIHTMKVEGNAYESSSDLLTGLSCSQRFDVIGSDIYGLSCSKCHQRVRDIDSFEMHYLSNHSVTRLLAGDFSRTTVELICNTSHSQKPSKTKRNSIKAILKIHNLQRVVAEFEDYREIVKIRANKLSKKHSRCMADGNEFLGFHGTALTCSLALSNSSNLCFSDQCGVCQILRHGFASKTRPDGIKGVLTVSTSSTALQLVETDLGRSVGALRAVVLCRVVAGRVHKPVKKFENTLALSEFDSLALKMGSNYRIDELCLLNCKALLPCFVIIFNP